MSTVGIWMSVFNDACFTGAYAQPTTADEVMFIDEVLLVNPQTEFQRHILKTVELRLLDSLTDDGIEGRASLISNSGSDIDGGFVDHCSC
jgi:hypothetical protein